MNKQGRENKNKAEVERKPTGSLALCLSINRKGVEISACGVRVRLRLRTLGVAGGGERALLPVPAIHSTYFASSSYRRALLWFFVLLFSGCLKIRLTMTDRFIRLAVIILSPLLSWIYSSVTDVCPWRTATAKEKSPPECRCRPTLLKLAWYVCRRWWRVQNKFCWAARTWARHAPWCRRRDLRAFPRALGVRVRVVLTQPAGSTSAARTCTARASTYEAASALGRGEGSRRLLCVRRREQQPSGGARRPRRETRLRVLDQQRAQVLRI
jgi:hypothetical protein